MIVIRIYPNTVYIGRIIIRGITLGVFEGHYSGRSNTFEETYSIDFHLDNRLLLEEEVDYQV